MACLFSEFSNVAKTSIELGANVNAYRPRCHAGTPLHLAANSTTLRNSKHISPDALLQLTFDPCRVLTRECKTSLQKQFHAAVASGSLISYAGQCHEVRSKPNQVPDEHVHEFKSTPSIIKLD